MKSLARVKACFKALEFEFNKDSFEDRLKAQKIVYLLHQKGVGGLDFGFNLYVHGPYSPDLTLELFQGKADPDKLSAADEKRVSEFKEVFTGLDANILAAAGTYAFYAFGQGLDAIEATKKTRKAKANLPLAKVELGMSKAKELLFEPTKEELEMMKKEVEPWQAAAFASWRRFD